MLVAILLLLITATAHAAAPLPDAQWNEETRLALAQCLVAESGWGSPTEKAAIAFVLAKRWKASHVRFPKRTFRGVVRAYCSVFKAKAKRAWVLQLPWGTPRAAYVKFAAAWKEVRLVVLDFENGFLADPCEPAIHWGAPENHWRIQKGIVKDVVRTCRFVEIEDKTVEMQNHFYKSTI